MDQRNLAGHYAIHDNGGRPFLIEVVSEYREGRKYARRGGRYTHNYRVKVYQAVKCDWHWLFDALPDDVQLAPGEELDGEEVYVVDAYRGNTLLTHTGNEVTFYGPTVYRFAVPDGEVLFDLRSPIGPNDVPYPLVRGSSGVVYVLGIDRVTRYRHDALTPFDWVDFLPYLGKGPGGGKNVPVEVVIPRAS